MTMRHRRRGLTLVEGLVGIGAAALLAATVLPLLAAQSCDSMLRTSMTNLQRLGVAHGMYANDWNDRQFTLVRDDFGAYDDCCVYPDHPSVVLGADCDGTVWQFSLDGPSCGPNCGVIQPLNFSGAFAYSGAFRLPNARGFHEYVGGRFFSPTFYAPKDAVYAEVQPLFDVDCEYDPAGNDLVFRSSYALSPAAMFHPDVFRRASKGGYQAPTSFDDGFASPTVSQALYPDLKTRMIEHDWLNGRPPGVSTNPCFEPPVPYFFNQGFMSTPATLFFDGHVGLLGIQRAILDDDIVMHQSDEGLWSRDTPFGAGGYLSECAFDFAETSIHILTTEGIRGRDRLADP